MGSYDWRDKNWDPEIALQSLVQEQEVLGLTPQAQALQILKDNAPYAASSIVHLALYGDNERTRLAAAQYVVDRNLGRIGDEKQDNTTDDPINRLLAEVVTDIEKYANEGK